MPNMPLPEDELRVLLHVHRATVERLNRRLGGADCTFDDLTERNQHARIVEQLETQLAERLKLDSERDERLTKHAGDVERLSADIEAARKRTRAAYTTMQKAVAALIDAARAQRRAVESAQVRMRELDLPASGVDGATGFVRDGVRLAGEWHLLPSPIWVAGVAFAEALATRTRRGGGALPGLDRLLSARNVRSSAVNTLGGQLPNPPAESLPPVDGQPRREIAPPSTEREPGGEAPYLVRQAREKMARG